MVDHRSSARHDRLKEALRANLKRRKAQAKGQAKGRAERQAKRHAERPRGEDHDQRNSVESDETDSGSEA
jgi:hypothetical protein